jgi:hypothetical protein
VRPTLGLVYAEGAEGPRGPDPPPGQSVPTLKRNDSMPRAVDTYRFTLILSGGDGLTEEVQDALFVAGCDDALLGERGGGLYLDFDRSAASLTEAVLSAVRDVEGAGVGLSVSRVEFGELVSASEIARRANISRETVRLYALGKRGPGRFPAPVAGVKGHSNLYRWGEVAGWMKDTTAARGSGVLTDLEGVELINAALGVRRLAPISPKADVVFKVLGLDKPRFAPGRFVKVGPEARGKSSPGVKTGGAKKGGR